MRSCSVICNRVVEHADIGARDISEVTSDAAGCVAVKDVILDLGSEEIAGCRYLQRNAGDRCLAFKRIIRTEKGRCPIKGQKDSVDVIHKLIVR